LAPAIQKSDFPLSAKAAPANASSGKHSFGFPPLVLGYGAQIVFVTTWFSRFGSNEQVKIRFASRGRFIVETSKEFLISQHARVLDEIDMGCVRIGSQPIDALTITYLPTSDRIAVARCPGRRLGFYGPRIFSVRRERFFSASLSPIPSIKDRT